MPLSQVPRAPRVWVPTLRRALSPESTRGFQGALSPCTPAPAGHYRDAANREPGGHSSGCTVMQKRCPLGVRGEGWPLRRSPEPPVLSGASEAHHHRGSLGRRRQAGGPGPGDRTDGVPEPTLWAAGSFQSPQRVRGWESFCV